MDDEEAVAAVLVAPQLTRFRQLCDVDGPIQPRFDGYTKHVLLADDRAFFFPRSHTVVGQIARTCRCWRPSLAPRLPDATRRVWTSFRGACGPTLGRNRRRLLRAPRTATPRSAVSAAPST